jgi:hypothetical protein
LLLWIYRLSLVATGFGFSLIRILYRRGAEGTEVEDRTKKEQR